MDIVVGLDGFHTGLLDITPNIKEIWGESLSGVSKSVIPTVTGPAWASILTSQQPGNHGISAFMKKDEYIFDGSDVREKTFYELLYEKGKKILLQNIPYTYPPNIKGDLITSWLTKSSDKEDYVYPTNLFQKYSSLQEYDFGLDMKDSTEYHLGKLKSRIPFIKEVIEKRNHDLVFFYIHATDAVQHKDLKGAKTESRASNQVMKTTDKLISWIKDDLDEKDNLILMSDHGFTMKKGAFLLNDWLMEKGYLKTSEEGKELRQMGEVTDEKKFFNIGKIGRKIWSSPLQPAFKPIKSFLEEKLDATFVSNPILDTEKSLAYSVTTWDKGIHINPSRGREKILKNLMSDLESVPDIHAVPREKLYPNGKKLENFPDILITSDKWKIEKGFHGSPFNKEPIPDHHIDGIFAGYGNNFDEKRIECFILDIAPTLLTLQNVPIPINWEGDSLVGSPKFQRPR